MNRITLENVTYIYGEGTPYEQVALDGVSLEILGDRITGIIGHTGSGKSTMMQLLNGLSVPTKGKILFDGDDVNITPREAYETWKNRPQFLNLSKSARKKAIKTEVLQRKKNLCFRVGLVMQYPEYQLFEETVEKDIAFGPMNMGLTESEIHERVLEASAFAGVDPAWLSLSPFDLSGGEKRRVAIAGVIAMRPEVLVLDEPAAGLDPRGRERIFESIRKYHEQTGSAVIIVSHSMEDMAEYCDDVVVLSSAKVILQGSREEVFSHSDLLKESGLDVPQITQLIGSLRKKGWDLPENIYTVERAKEALLDLFRKEAGEK